MPTMYYRTVFTLKEAGDQGRIHTRDSLTPSMELELAQNPAALRMERDTLVALALIREFPWFHRIERRDMGLIAVEE